MPPSYSSKCDCSQLCLFASQECTRSMAGLRRGEGGYGKVTEIALSFKFKLVNFIVQMVPLVPVGKVPVPGYLFAVFLAIFHYLIVLLVVFSLFSNFTISTSSTTAQYRLRSEGSLVHWAVRNARVKGRAPGVYALTNRVERSAVLTSTVISLGCKPSAFRHVECQCRRSLENAECRLPAPAAAFPHRGIAAQPTCHKICRPAIL